MKDEVKDALTTAAATGLALVAAAGAGGAIAAAAIPGVVGIAFMRLYDRRTKRWWEAIIDGASSPEELQTKIADGLFNEKERVVAGVVGGARAAASAIEVDAVLAIAELSRRFLEAEDLPIWFYRGALTLFE